jgi:uncharacterized protein DUF2568
MLPVALAVRFLLELCLLLIAAWAPFRIVGGVAGVGLAATAAIAFGALWGIFLSPRRSVEIGVLPRLLLEAAIFVAAALLLVLAGHPSVAVLLLVVEFLDKAAVGWFQRSDVSH